MNPGEGLKKFSTQENVNTTPLLKDLYEHITPCYATDWKVIGTLLGLPREELKIIENENQHKAVPCCNAMLEKWLDVDNTATWNRLLSALHSPAVSSGQAPVKESTIPLLKDLYEHITPQYATDWKVIGTLLGLSREELKAIEIENYHKLVPCCNVMFEKWLDVDNTATWNKLLSALHSPAVSSARETEKVTVAPLLKDLYEHITPHYATNWKVIGTLLGLPREALRIIEHDNHHKAVCCCNDMLEKWLDVDNTATWNKLLSALHSPAVSSSQPVEKVTDTTPMADTDKSTALEQANAISTLQGRLSQLNIQIRFKFDKDSWPPNQPKEFTPLLLIHHQDQHTVNEETALQLNKLVQSGGVHPNHYSSELLKETPKYKTTKKLIDFLIPLQESNDPQFILVEGLPGIGKSVLLQEIAHSWGKKQLLQNFKVVLLVQLRNPAVQQISDISELLELFFKGYSEASDIVAVCCKYLFNNDGKDAVFLFDGFDEFPEYAQTDSLVIRILNREILPCCGLVISSRPHASVGLREQATVRVDILGFAEEERKLYIEQSLKGKPQKIKQLTDYLVSNLTINSLCSIPFNIVVLTYLYKQGIPLPNNSTELYNYFIGQTICRHLAKSGRSLENVNLADLNNLPEPYNTIVKQLSKLSLVALHNNKLIFTIDDVKTCCPDIISASGDINGFGLLQAVQHFGLYGKIMTFNFIHFSIQEFLAAYHVTQVALHEELEVLKAKFWSEIHSNMFAMYTSLTKGQRPAFKQFLSGGDDRVTISEIFLKDQLKCLRLFRCFYEANEEQILKVIQKAKVFDNNKIDLTGINLSPYDLECITLFLACSSCKEWLNLDLPDCHIQDHGFHVLHRGLICSDITIKVLNMRGNSLTKSSSTLISNLTIHCKVEELGISRNDTIGDHALYEMLINPLSRLIGLYMFRTNLSTSNAINLLTGIMEVNQLKILHIDDNKITDDACDFITTRITANTSLVELWMWGNNISAAASERLLQALCLNNTLEDLWLPSYPDDVKKRIRSLQEEANKSRINKGYKKKLYVLIL